MSKPLVIFAVTALILIWNTLFLWPQYQDYRILKVERQNKRQELAFRNEYLANLESLSARLENYPDQLKRVNLAVPDRANIAHVFDWLVKASASHGLVLKSLGLAAAAPSLQRSGVRASGIRFEVSGPYPALLSFLAELENSARLFELTGFVFTSPEKGDIFSFEINLKVHSF